MDMLKKKQIKTHGNEELDQSNKEESWKPGQQIRSRKRAAPLKHASLEISPTDEIQTQKWSLKKNLEMKQLPGPFGHHTPNIWI